MYEIVFETREVEYKYEIDAKTGALLDHEIELDDDDDDDDDDNDQRVIYGIEFRN